LQTRYFDFHQDLPAATIARMLHGRIVYQQAAPGEWIAVIEIDKIRNARCDFPQRNDIPSRSDCLYNGWPIKRF
jgi:hypothetical protein